MDTSLVTAVPEDLTSAGKIKDDWKLEKVRYILQYFPEVQLNLTFLNPFLKSTKAMFAYRLLMRAFQHNDTGEDNNRFIQEVTKEIIEYKRKLYE